MSEKLIRKIEEKIFIGWTDGKEIWDTKTTTIPLF